MIKVFTNYLIVLSLCQCSLYAQNSSILDSYVREGLESNLALKQKEAGYEKALQVLKEAKSYFYPQLSLNARYTVADGGRLIEFPLGDLLNPVYSTLNALTGTSNFPQVENQEFRFFRPREHETKIQVIQPLFNTDIYFNKKIKEGMVETERVDVETYKRHLVEEIKVSYFNMIKANEALHLIHEIKTLAIENQRVNEKLLQNNMITRDRILRAEAELSRIDQQLANAEKDSKIAGAYFNFLLNRSLEAEISVDKEMVETVFFADHDLKNLTENAIMDREELIKLGILEDISGSVVRMNRMRSLPELILAVDYGFQGTSYRFTGDDDFVIASVVLRWNIFHGFQNRHKIRQSQIDQKIIRTRKEEAAGMVELEVIQSWYELQAAAKSLVSADKEYQASRLAFEIVNKQYNNGMVSMLEYLDARTSMMMAGTNQIIVRHEYLSKIVEFERIACLYPIQNH
jgi:outer membrane protein